MHTEVAAEPLSNYHFFITQLHSGRSAVATLHARSGISAHCGLFVFARSCHIQPVSTCPWEIYTEPLVWGEAIKWAGDMLPEVLIFGQISV